MKRETKKTMLLAAAAALSLSAGAAYAGEIEGIQPNTFFQQPGPAAKAATR